MDLVTWSGAALAGVPKTILSAPKLRRTSECTAARGSSIAQARRNPASLSIALDRANGQPGIPQRGFRLGNCYFAEMKDGGRQHRAGMAFFHAIHQILDIADAARRDHRNFHRVGHGTGEFQVIARLHAIAVHGGQQDLARAETHQLARMFHRIDAGGFAAAMGENLVVTLFALLGVDGGDNTLAAEFLRRHFDKFRTADGGGIDRDLVGPRQQQGANVFQRAHPAAHRQRHETDFRCAMDHLQQSAAIFMRGGDVEKTKLVGSGLVINDGLLHRIAGIAQTFEIHALDHAAVLDVQAGDHSHLLHWILPFAMAAIFIRARPVTASAGAPVVRVRTSASSSMSSASPSLSLFQRWAWFLNAVAREKCTGGRSRFITMSMASPRAAHSRACNNFWKWPKALRSSWAGWVSDAHSRSSSRSSLARSPLPAASQALSLRASASSPITARTSSRATCFLPCI